MCENGFPQILRQRFVYEFIGEHNPDAPLWGRTVEGKLGRDAATTEDSADAMEQTGLSELSHLKARGQDLHLVIHWLSLDTGHSQEGNVILNKVTLQPRAIPGKGQLRDSWTLALLVFWEAGWVGRVSPQSWSHSIHCRARYLFSEVSGQELKKTKKFCFVLFFNVCI